MSLLNHRNGMAERAACTQGREAQKLIAGMNAMGYCLGRIDDALGGKIQHQWRIVAIKEES